MKYNLIVFCLLLYGCSNSSDEEILIEKAFDFIFNSYLPKLSGEDYSVSNRFTVEIDAKLMHKDLDESREWLDSLDFDLENLIDKSEEYKGLSILSYIDTSKYGYLVPDDSISDKNTHFFFSVPIYNSDRTMVFHYMLVELRKEVGWSHQYNIFRIDSEGVWHQKAVLEILRDSLVNSYLDS